MSVIGLTLAGWLLGTAVPAQAAQNVSLGVAVHILNPPNAITNLTASPVGILDGDIQLVWTAPANQNAIGLTLYQVRFATFPANNPAQAEAWWSSIPLSQVIVSPAHAPGVTEFSIVSGLTVGVTYYFGIKSIDLDAQISPIDTRVGTAQQAASKPLQTGGGPPATPASLTAVAQSTGSLQWQWTASGAASFYTLNAFPGGGLIVQTPLLQYVESGFTPNTAVARTIRAGNGFGLSAPSPATTVYTLAAVPTSLQVTRIGYGNLDIAWNASGNSAGTLYRPERSTDNVSFTPLTFVTSPSLTDTGLTPLTTYYYRVRAVNGDGVQTSTSATLAVFMPDDAMPPRAPLGFKGDLPANGQNFTLSWEAVTLNEDGTPITDLAGYHIYRSSAVGGSFVRLTTAPLSVPVFADQVNGQTFIYKVHAIDTHGNESADSLLADSSPEANVIFVGADGLSSVLMPRDVNNLLRSGFNKYGVPLTLVLVEEPLANDGSIIRSVRLQLLRGDNLTPVNDLSFPVAHATVSVGFDLINGEVGRGGPSPAPQIAAGVSPSQLSLYWSNGVSWIKLGGVVNVPAQTVSVRTAFLGNYQLRSAPRAASLSLERTNVYPRVFTPNGDGLNDRVYFVLENPNNAGVHGEIFDKDGRHVATLPDPSTIGGIGTTLIWDGHDASGNVVPGGAYIYKITGEGQTFTGTVGVAR